MHLSQGSYTAKYALASDHKRYKRKLNDRSRKKKIRRILLKQKRENLRKVTERAEGTMYKSNCGIDEAIKSNISQDSGEKCSVESSIVYFDLETTGFAKDADILQIAAVCNDNLFILFIYPD